MDNHNKISLIGRIKFFDYNKGKFGFIESMYESSEIVNKDTYINIESLKTESKLYENDIVYYEVVNLSGKAKGINVKLLSEIDENQFNDIFAKIGASIIIEFPKTIFELVNKYDLGKVDFTKKIKSFKISEIQSVIKKFLDINVNIDKIIEDVFTDISISDCLEFLNIKYNRAIIEIAINKINENHTIFIEPIIDCIIDNEKEALQIHNINFLFNDSIDISLEKSVRILKLTGLKEYFIINYSRFTFNSIYGEYGFLKLTAIYREIIINEQPKLVFKNSFKYLIVSNIFDYVNDFISLDIIESIDDLLNLVIDNDIHYDSFLNYIYNNYPNIYSDLTKRKIITHVISNEIKDLINIFINCRDEFIRNEILITLQGDAKYNSLIKQIVGYYANENVFGDVEEGVIEKYSEYFVKVQSKELILYSVKNECTEILLSALDNYKPNDCKVVFDIIKAFSLNKSLLENENNVINYAKVIIGILQFVKNAPLYDVTGLSSSYQIFLIKYIVYLVHLKKVTREMALRCLKNIKFSNLSSVLIQSLIMDSNINSNYLIKDLNKIFNLHLELNNQQNYTKDEYLDLFQMRDLLKRCNGRKYYNQMEWNKGRETRNYIDINYPYSTHEEMDCFCEGRPWKKIKFWEQDKNVPINHDYELFWCRNKPCAARNSKVNLEDDFYNWSIEEIFQTLGLRSEVTFISTLSGWVNKINVIVASLFCRECNGILYPVTQNYKLLGYHSVPVFHCINPSCNEKRQVRFTHCLNSKCDTHEYSEPLDSRDCESCKPEDPNHTGLKCHSCGTGCPTCEKVNPKYVVNEEYW